MFAKFAKVKEYFAEFLIAVCLLTGLLYAVTTAYQTSFELELTKKQYEDSLKLIEKQSQVRLEIFKEMFQTKESEMKKEIKNIKKILLLIARNTKDLSMQQIDEFLLGKTININELRNISKVKYGINEEKDEGAGHLTYYNEMAKKLEKMFQDEYGVVSTRDRLESAIYFWRHLEE